MFLRYLATICFSLCFLVGCSSSTQRRKCEDKCSTDYACPVAEPNPVCDEALAACQDNCAEEAVAEARGSLSVAASRVYAIESLYYQTGGCAHGAVATDASPRCNSPSDVVLAHFTGLTACAPTNASLTFQRQEWQQSTVITVRASLRPVIDPPVGISSACSDNLIGAKWDSSGVQSWTVPGARGVGTDVTAASVTATIPVNGTAMVTIPLGSVLDTCAPGGECVLVLDASEHVWDYPGTFSLFYDCAGPPPVCGDGAKAASEACDDGNTAAGDGCSATCALEPGWTCPTAGAPCGTTCGDGVKAGAEECDDGVANGSNAPCSANCTAQTCGCSSP